MNIDRALNNLRIELDSVYASDGDSHSKLETLNEFLELVTNARRRVAEDIVDELTDYYEVTLHKGDERETRKLETKAMALAWMSEFFGSNHFDEHHLGQNWMYEDGSGGGATSQYMLTFDDKGFQRDVLLDVWDAVNGKYKLYSETRKHRATEQRVAELEAEIAKLREKLESVETD